MDDANTPPLQPAQHLAVSLPVDAAGWRFDRALAAAILTLSREQLKKLIAAGAVHLAGTLQRDPATRVKGGEAVQLTLPASQPATTPAQAIPLSIRFEDAHLLVVDKPAGLVVHPAAGNPDGTLVNALLHHCGERLSRVGGATRPGIVHRLDKDTSGLLVVAKTDRAHSGLARLFASRKIERAYLAVVAGLPAPPAGRIETQLARSPANRQKIAVVAPPDGRLAITRYRLTEALHKAALIECRLETGRTHQIRVHMAHIGHPLVGDPVYGQGRLADICRELGFRRQALHAATLGFRHPLTDAELRFSSPLPDDIQLLLRRLRA